MNQKIDLIYIASNGRSGSTLLDMLLGAQQECFSMGELQILPLEIKYEMQKCSCGQKVPQCPFWSRIIAEHKKEIDGIDYFRKGGSGKVLRGKELKEIIFDHFSSKRLKRIEEYGRCNRDLMKAVLKNIDKEHEKVSYLVDASKDPYRLYWLQKSGYFNISVIHIIKHPQGFVYSMTRPYRGLDRFQRSIRMSLRWIIENSLIEYISKKIFDKEHYHKISYEVLAASPDKTLQALLNDLHCTSNTRAKIMETGHAISGNAMRFGSKKITLDQQWKHKQPLLIKTAVFMITAPFYLWVRK